MPFDAGKEPSGGRGNCPIKFTTVMATADGYGVLRMDCPHHPDDTVYIACRHVPGSGVTYADDYLPLWDLPYGIASSFAYADAMIEYDRRCRITADLALTAAVRAFVLKLAKRNNAAQDEHLG